MSDVVLLTIIFLATIGAFLLVFGVLAIDITHREVYIVFALIFITVPTTLSIINKPKLSCTKSENCNLVHFIKTNNEQSITAYADKYDKELYVKIINSRGTGLDIAKSHIIEKTRDYINSYGFAVDNSSIIYHNLKDFIELEELDKEIINKNRDELKAILTERLVR